MNRRRFIGLGSSLALAAVQQRSAHSLPAAAAEAKPADNLPDPKDKVGVQNFLHDAMLASDDNRPDDARKSLEKALQLGSLL